MRRLLLVRHAQSEWNAVGRWQGRADPGLSPAGRLQLRGAGRALAAELEAVGADGIAGLCSSDLRRAIDTAAGLGAAVGWPAPPAQIHALGEHDVGEWTGLTHDEIERRWPGMLARWATDPTLDPPGGEPRSAVDTRVRAAVAALAADAAEGVTVVVTHGGVLRAVARWWDLADRPVANLGGYLVDAVGTTVVREVHLAADTISPAPLTASP